MPELSFKCKEFVYNHHLTVPFRPLEPHPDKSIGDVRLDGNLIIHGDNLHALKALMPMYAGKVDCIFVDPPYNTGNDGWCYNDNVNSPVIQEWLNNNPVGIEDGLRHDKWCAMIYPRLRLLHELLSETGALFISIDDNETHHLRSLLDDIFGEDCFLAEIIWRSSDSSNNDAKRFSVDHNTIYAYSKDREWVSERLARTDDDNAHYSNPDNDPNGPWFAGNLSSPNPRDNLRYTISHPDGRVLESPSNGWRWSKEILEKKIESGEVVFNDTERGILRKTYLKDQLGLAPSTVWADLGETGHNRNAKYELKNLFPDLETSQLFPTPKPSKLIKKILEVSGGRDSIVLDSFAGSGTTAHAVLALNKIDGGSRRFILVECEDYANEVTAERMNRVINGYEYQGTKKEELLREKITWSNFSRDNARNKLLSQIQSIQNQWSDHFDTIRKTIKDGELIVIGEKKITERMEGMGGEFTFCTLGEPIDFDKMLTGEALPSFEALGSALFHTATNLPFDASQMDSNPLELDGVGYLGASGNFHVWLIYKPDLDFLKSRDAALTLVKSEAIAAKGPDGRHLVFAPARFVSQKMLAEANLPVEFAPLPFALYRIERGAQS